MLLNNVVTGFRMELENAGFVSDAREPGYSRALAECGLSNIDINLLVALNALLEYRNVSYAARRIGQTQPAMSRLLSRLRDLLGDDLLVRGSTGMRLTTRAEYLVELVPIAMSQACGIIGSEGKSSDARVSISGNLMPALLPHFTKSSNLTGQRLAISSHRLMKDGSTQLLSRIVDFVLGPVLESGNDIDHEIVFSEDWVTLVAMGSPGISEKNLSIEAFLAMIHINVVSDGEEVFPQNAEALSMHGLQQSAMVEVPDATSGASMVSQGGFALTVPRSTAGWLKRMFRLSALEPPIDIRRHEIGISWFAGDSEGIRPPPVDEIAALTREALAEYEARSRLSQNDGDGEP